MSDSETWSPDELRCMRRALTLARRGQGHVEPNPMVGAVLARDGQIVGEGWHRRFGGPHAEIEAIRAAGSNARGATLFVTLEPCCHEGKTPPCTGAILAAGIARVECALRDPFPMVSGNGIQALRSAGVLVREGLLYREALSLNAPYFTLIRESRSWVIAKWAMSWDGKIATKSGASRWFSGETSRSVVHRLRGRVDAIVVGRGTVAADDPLLTARPPGPRTAARVILDSQAWLPRTSQLVRTAAEAPVIVATSPHAPPERCASLQAAGCEVLAIAEADRVAQVRALLQELGRRRFTNVLVEGGSTVLGTFHDAGLLDEVHIFLAPKLIGGKEARSPMAGAGVADVPRYSSLRDCRIKRSGEDIYVQGRVGR